MPKFERITVTGARYIGKRATSFDDLNSNEFIADLQKGSDHAFFVLVDRLLRPLTHFLMGKMHVIEADAEELASDVFMKVQTSIGTFTPGPQGRLTTWIFQIAKNRAIDYHRASKRAAEELQAFVEEVSRHSGKPFAGRNEGAVQWLQSRLSAMDENERNILLWRAHDFSYTDISNWLGITEENARVRHKRALDKLKAEAQKGAG